MRSNNLFFYVFNLQAGHHRCLHNRQTDKKETALETRNQHFSTNSKHVTHTAKPVARTVCVPLSRTPAGGHSPSALIGTPGRHSGARTHVVASSGTSGCAKRSLGSSVETFRCQAVHIEPFEEVFRNSLRGLGHVPPVAVEELSLIHI